MKFIPAVIIALAAVAAAAPDDARPPTASPTASPTPSPAACTPGTYACTADARGWQVCDVSGQFVVAGTCPPGTSCVFFRPSLSPYCVPPGFRFPGQ
ncbi:Uncharacterized protein SAPIO_CDS3790 [Scedosporium apiospermum]|uniref:Chitin-binding type-2 domain-containing protein n=1 Tax=Pseudallescheria apiosperma TaxID=563466 RepID=A0A084G9N9_PSEDA|nr:Uncharacterized protein SAPIO_CDS3790 [Scedosporium apiospermum]KEZ44051.1 Uncharacterized protein SAPIO_CDS3790 [Scedosporium apiospermum]